MHSAALLGGYSRLEDGLTFNGGQRIETGYCPTASDRFECEVTVNAVQPNASAAVFGTVREQEPERTFAFYVRQDGVDSSVVAYGDTARGGFFPRGKKVSLSVGPDGATWTWDGGSDRLSLTPGFARDGMTPLLIGDANAARLVGDSVPAGTGAAMTLHRFRIWRGGLELVHDYEPGEKDSRIGLRDVKDGSFLAIQPQSESQTVKVTVANDIPHVSNVVVSNRTGKLEGKKVGNDLVYEVKKGDDIFAGYEVEADYVSLVKNPISYPQISKDQKIDEAFLKTVRRLEEHIPYRAWDAEKSTMVECVCSNAFPVTADTQALADGRWYAVTGTVSRGTITVSGSAHLILCDGAALTVRGGENEAGVTVVAGNALTIYGQSAGTGELVATGVGGGAGIGGGLRAVNGDITVSGGRVTAKSTVFGAGIGGGRYCNQWTGPSIGTIAINYGTVMATGGDWGAGIGGGPDGAGGPVTINGGLVMAQGGRYGAGIGGGGAGSTAFAGGRVTINGGTVDAKAGEFASDIGGGWAADFRKLGEPGTLTIDGGSIKAVRVAKDLAKNSTPTNVYCVTAKLSEEGRAGREERGGESEEGRGLRIEGLGNYGTNDIYAVKNDKGVDCVYLWLPDGTHRFAVSDGARTDRYFAVVHGRGVTVEPLAPVGFFVNGIDIGSTGSDSGWDYTGKNLTLNAAGPYVLSGVATNDEVHIHVISPNAATVILSNAVVFASGLPSALNVDQNTSLLMAGGTSCLAATNNFPAVSVGPQAVLTVGFAPGADEAESMIGVFNYGDQAAIAGAGAVAVNGGTLAVWADRQAASVPLTRAADVFCMVVGSDPETARVVDKYNGEAYVLVTASVAPVTPGRPVGPFATAGAATNVLAIAFVEPSAPVSEVLTSGALQKTYCDMFALGVTGGDAAWFVEAALTPVARTNLAETANGATRQIPVAAIARLKPGVTTNVTAHGCAPGFYYSLYDGSALTNIVADANATNLNVLCGADAKVVFPEVKKPSDAAGFFSIGVKETPGITPPDGSLAPITIKPGATVEVK